MIGSTGLVAPARIQILPTVDPGTHTVELRLDLPALAPSPVPGMFARVWLPTSGALRITTTGRLYVPASAIVRRAEMIGVYVLDSTGTPQLRQVRPGHLLNDEMEILTGLSAGEKVALDPDAAARFK